ncbi:MAG: hypothetical protein J1F04_08090 [Oscillospiraceae bacterium]|nr:hypothetical protein [Oscillospiraceae bacterium]
MDLDIINSLSTGKLQERSRAYDNGEFSELLKADLAQRRSESLVIVSPKLEETLSEDPDLCEEIRQKIAQLGQSRDNIIIVDRNGEVTKYSAKNESDNFSSPTAEELKEVAKARARRKARLDAYFQLLEKVCIKRKLVEQENAKRARGKKYRSVTELGVIVKSRQLSPAPKNPDYFF